MSRRLIIVALLASCCPPEPAKQVTTVKPPTAEQKDLAQPGEVHLQNVRQLTFGGDNAEAYWSFAGDRLIMQTNHAPYHCDQIEELTVATRLLELRGASLAVEQRIERAGDELARLTLRLACIGPGGRPARLPEPLRAALAPFAPRSLRIDTSGEP